MRLAQRDRTLRVEMSVEPQALITVQNTLESLESALTHLREAVAHAEVHLRESRRCYQHVVRVTRVAIDALPASVPGSGRLTRQELRVAVLVAAGKTNVQVAAEYHLSVHTVKSHVKHILRKLDVESRWQLREVLANTDLRLVS